MEELVDEGLAKNIGVRLVQKRVAFRALTDLIVPSNVAGGLLVDIHSYARIEPQVLQVELHPYLTQEPLLRLAKTLGIAVTAYSSFGPQSYLELGFKGGVEPLFQQDIVVKAAQAHDKRLLNFMWCTT
jgi:D-xylose reductase